MTWKDKEALADKFKNIPSSELALHVSDASELETILEVRSTYNKK